MTPLPAALAGVLWMLGSAATFAALNGALKLVAAVLPVAVVLFCRLGFSLAWMAPWALRRGWTGIATRRPLLHLARTVSGSASLATVVVALEDLPLADATALAFTRPLFMVVLASLFLGERPGAARILWTLLGFSGVVVVARPGAGLDPAMAWALASAAFAAINLVFVKRLGLTEPPARIVFWYAALGTVLTAPWAAWEWQAPTAFELGVICGAAMLSVIGQYCVAQAARRAEATVIAPLDFAQLPFAAVLGMVLFAELPAWTTVLGAVLILVAVLGIAHAAGRGRGAARAR